MRLICASGFGLSTAQQLGGFLQGGRRADRVRVHAEDAASGTENSRRRGALRAIRRE
jgi:hypothetical protein